MCTVMAQEVLKRFRTMGFDFNARDTCMENGNVKGKMHSMRFHVDNLMSSHVDEKVNDEFSVWLNEQHGECSEVKATRGNVHDCLGLDSREVKWKLTWWNTQRKC